MKKLLLLINICLVTQVFGQSLDRSIRPKAGPAPEIKIADAQTFTLPNGLKVFVVENNKLPRVTASIQFDVYPELQGDKAGYKDMINDMMTAGTQKRSKDKFNEEFDFIGANIGANSSGVFASGLKRFKNEMFDLLSDMVLNPAFPADELEKLKTQTLSGLQTIKDDANAISANIGNVVNYGGYHPYGEVTTEATVKNINLEVFKNYHNKYYRPNVAYMAIVGDITLAEAKELVNKYFGTWQKANVPVATYPKVKVPASNKVFLGNKEGAVQSVINVTYPVDLKPGTPDVIPGRIMNQILGGGSTGHLFLNLREKHGWTYGAYSSLSADRVVGEFTAGAQARNPVTDSSITEILAEMKKLKTSLVSNEELQSNKNLLSGAFAMGLESPQTIAAYAISIERYKLPKDYYKNYLKTLAAITPAQIQATAKKYLNAENANIVVVGAADEMEEKLKKFGPVERRDMYGQVTKATVKTAAPAGVTAETIYNKYIDAIGGEKALKGLKDLKVEREASIQGQVLKISSAQKSPDKFLQTISVSGMTFQKRMINGAKGYNEEQGNKKELTADELKADTEEADLQAELNQAKYGNKRTLRNQDGDLYVVDVVSGTGKKSIEYYDVKTGLLMKETTSEDTPEGPMSVTTEFSDYREVPGANGYKIPYMIKVPAGPGMTLDAEVKTVEVNKGIDDSVFQ